MDGTMSNRLQGKIAVVTAAANGIGRATAQAFAREGAVVIATDINPEALAGLDGCKHYRLDVTDGAAIAAFALEAGPVDILFNCAGFVHGGTILECDEQAWEQSF